MRRRTIPLLLAIALSAAGVVFSAQLLSKHMLGGGAQWFEQLCDWGAAGGGGCDAVLASRWAVIPPATEEQRRAELEGDQPATRRLYVAGLGLVYFSTLTVWFAGVGAPSYDRRFLHDIGLAVLAAGLCGSIFLLWALWSDARAFCPGCFFSHVANFGVFACATALRPRKPASNDGAAPPSSAGVRHRYWHLLGASIGGPSWREARRRARRFDVLLRPRSSIRDCLDRCFDKLRPTGHASIVGLPSAAVVRPQRVGEEPCSADQRKHYPRDQKSLRRP